MEALRAEGVHKVFRVGLRRRPVEALRGVSLRVAEGEAVGILGPNGAGKSTLLRVCVGLLRPSRGEVWLWGRPVRHPAARARVGYLPEAPAPHPFLRGEEFLRICGQISGLEGRALRWRVAEVLERLGLQEVAARRVGTYSQGQRQRLALAQALLHQPRLLVLDEPSLGLDPEGRREVWGLLAGLRREGRALLICSHLREDLELCDRLLVLEGGRICSEGSGR